MSDKGESPPLIFHESTLFYVLLQLFEYIQQRLSAASTVILGRSTVIFDRSTRILFGSTIVLGDPQEYYLALQSFEGLLQWFLGVLRKVLPVPGIFYPSPVNSACFSGNNSTHYIKMDTGIGLAV